MAACSINWQKKWESNPRKVLYEWIKMLSQEKKKDLLRYPTFPRLPYAHTSNEYVKGYRIGIL
jgi:hypothetical protein